MQGFLCPQLFWNVLKLRLRLLYKGFATFIHPPQSVEIHYYPIEFRGAFRIANAARYKSVPPPVRKYKGPGIPNRGSELKVNRWRVEQLRLNGFRRWQLTRTSVR